MEISFLRYLLHASGELRKLLLPSLGFHLDLETSCYLLSMASPINTAQNWLNNDRGIWGIVSKHTSLVSLCSVMSLVGRLGVTISPRSSGVWYYPLSGLTESQIKSNLVWLESNVKGHPTRHLTWPHLISYLFYLFYKIVILFSSIIYDFFFILLLTKGFYAQIRSLNCCDFIIHEWKYNLFLSLKIIF